MNKKLWMIFFIAFLIRLISLDQSLWLDEATTAKVVQNFSFSEIITKFSPTDFHPPLYYLFMKAWTHLFGYSEISLRMPSVLFSLLTGYLVFLMGRRLKNEQTNLFAAVFFLINPLIVYYSQEARMYMMVTMFLTSSLYYLLASLRVSSLKNKILFVVFTTLSFLTFYGSVFLIIPIVLYLIYKKQFRVLFMLLLLLSVTLLILSPLLLRQLTNAREQMQMIPNWKNVLGSVNIKNLILIPIKFSIGRISFEPKWLYWLISGIWSTIITLFVIRGGLRNKFLLYLTVAPVGLAILFSFFTPLLQYFRFMYVIPALSILLVALGRDKLHLRGANWFILTGLIIFSFVYLFIPAFHREDWKGLAKLPAQNSEVYAISSSVDPILYYRKDVKIIDLRKISASDLKTEITVVPYTSEIYAFDYQKILKAKRYKLLQHFHFRGNIFLEKWRFYPQEK